MLSGRVSQNLPIPKCSTCSQFVPLEQLGDHVCAPTPSLPKRTLSPAISPTKVTFQLRSSPLATSNVGSNNAGPSRDTSPLSINTMQANRARTPSNATTSTTPRLPSPLATPRPTLYPQPPASPVIRNTSSPNPGGPYRGPPPPSPGPSISRSGAPLPTPNMTPPRVTNSPASQKIAAPPGIVIPEGVSPQQSFVPPPERGIDTKTGGEAGMAGVGRRGFAAVARAAMFALPHTRPLGPQPQRKSNQPKYLDLDALSLTETPPLSAGSGYSSHSPGPVSPLPQLEFPSQPVATRTPSPPDRSLSTPTQPDFSKPAPVDPLSARLPFFEKFKNKLPGNNNDPPSTSVVRKNTSDSSNSGLLYRSETSSTSSRYTKDIRRPISPIDSESDYGGLAYADSTDSDYKEDGSGQAKNGSLPDMILRTGSTSSARRHRRPSGSEQSENDNNRTGILIGSTKPRSGHSHTPSASSVSSGRDRGNSAIVAQALGLSQTPSTDYGKMGGPGMMGGRLGRSGSESSSSRRNAGPDAMEDMKKALDAKIKARSEQSSLGSSSLLYRVNTSSTTDSRKDNDVIGSSGGDLKAHRSNTIQSPNSPGVKSVKLPMRSLTSPKLERDKALDGAGVRKERVRKVKVCLKCQKVVDNGRWVSVDGGGVLCEKCWKNMYLPKCRRCNLSIEKQAVSSSDGQLKGKYHKECFNCDTCHKPFPDKTFYVYDGRPLCAYHYHEANDSLCAAALCGQPIEGPCAVSHSGDRYHPEHMTCEYAGYPSCKQMLSEYWEIDGRMLCERHANSASRRGSDDEEEDEGWTKSKRRVTRFIDLASGGGGLGDDGLR